MNGKVKEIYKMAFKMDTDDWISSSNYEDKLIVRFMYSSDEGHGFRTKCYADFELKMKEGLNVSW